MMKDHKKTFGLTFLFPMLVIANLGIQGVALAKNGQDDPPGDDHGTSASGKDDTGYDDNGGQSSGKDDSAGDDSQGEHKHNGKSRIKLVLSDDTETTIGTRFQYKTSKRAVEFKAGLKIKLPSDVTDIVDRDSAENAVLTATLSNANGIYAECEFGFDRIKRGLTGKYAEYAIAIKGKVRNNGVLVRQNKGTCDIDLNTVGIQPGIPNVTSGDVAVVEFHIDPVPETGSETIELGRGQF